MKRLILSLMILSLPSVGVADDCLSYKTRPIVHIKNPSWAKEVVQPLQPMDLLHGNVMATMTENYEIIGDTTSIEDGFCVSLKSVEADIGYSDFMVHIDARHKPGSCTYNAIITHEDEHIRAYLSVIDDYHDEIKNAVFSASDSVMPVFVKNESEISGALDILNEKLQSHPELILMKQRIAAEQEIRNKRVDQIETGIHLKQCF